MPPKQILIVDDHALLRAGLINVIQKNPDLRVCGEAANAQEALRLVGSQSPDLVIVDVSLETGMNGLELVKHLRAQNQQLPILVLSMHDEDLYGERALAAGATGYLMKRAPVERLMQAITQVIAGRMYASEELAARVIAQTARGSKNGGGKGLSDRELEVLELIGRGVGTRDIATTLHLSVKTVETYRANLKQKLGIETAPQLVRYAVQWLESR